MSKPPYIYNIGYLGYEDGDDYRQLYHDSALSQDYLEGCIAEAVVCIIQKGEEDVEIPYCRVHQEICNYLIEKKGFRPVEFQAQWDCYGFHKILDKPNKYCINLLSTVAGLSDKVKEKLSKCPKSS